MRMLTTLFGICGAGNRVRSFAVFHADIAMMNLGKIKSRTLPDKGLVSIKALAC